MDDAIMADTQGIDPELVNALIELGREKGNQRIAALGAELERVREERDALQDALDSTMSVFFGENVPKHYEPGHVSVHVMALVATIDQLRHERDAAEAERDAARAAAARYKRRAYLLYATWCGYWGVPVDWGFLRTALYDPGVRDD